MDCSQSLVFIPSPGIGHLPSTVELAKLLVDRDHRLSIAVLIMKFPFELNKESPYANGSGDRIRFIDLQHDGPLEGLLSKPFGNFITEFVDLHKPAVKRVISELVAESTQLAGVIVDMFCMPMVDVANEFGIPSYSFFTSSAAVLGLIFHFQTLNDEEGRDLSEFNEPGTELSVPSFVNSLPVKVLPSGMLDDAEGKRTMFLNVARGLRKVKGILVNTFMELESLAIKSIISDDKSPPVYPVGPILNLGSTDKSRSNHPDDIISWLDDQPPSSVLFLCFGSNGCFDSDQVQEIARALELSGHPFLWSLRRPSRSGPATLASEMEYVSGILPEGFLERTRKIGKVIGWAPQAAVLAHPAVGGFVSHCGWNSTLESLWCGVPVATWPLYAEQQLNAFQLVKELGIAIEIKMDYKMGGGEAVAVEDIEKAIRQLMDSDGSSGLKQKVKEMSQKSKLSVKKDGSSYNSIRKFIDDVIDNVN